MSGQPWRERLGRARLREIRSEVTENDIELLQLMDVHRYLTTDHVARFRFANRSTRVAAIRAAHRQLARLAGLGLVVQLKGRVGGVRGGSKAAVWTSTDAGQRLLEVGGTRKRTIEPSLEFLEHQLAVVDMHLALETVAREGLVELLAVEAEPYCWRSYLGPTGQSLTLRPDLFAATASGEWEDRWFVEVDRATEPPARVVKKSRQYQTYRRAGAEQREHGVFPRVIWVAPDEKRREQLLRHLTPENGITPELFTVITGAQFPALIRGDLDATTGN